MCEMCGCAGRRTARQTEWEKVQTGIPIRIPVIAMPFDRLAADADSAGGKPVSNDARPDEIEERS